MKNKLSVLLVFLLAFSSFAEDGRDIFNEVSDGNLGAVPDQAMTPPTGVCSIASGPSSFLDEVISTSFKNDPSCQTVFTGNEGNTSKGDETYAKALAYAMAEEMCGNSELHQNFVGKKLNDGDALSLKEFDGSTIGKTNSNNATATYSLIYALGYRESSGNFIRPRDPWAKNNGSQKESGFTQTSANSLNDPYDGSKRHVLPQKVFKHYVSNLSKMSSQQQMAKFCLNDKLKENQQTKLILNDSKGEGKKTEFDHEGRDLFELFKDQSGSCKNLKTNSKGEYVANDSDNDAVVKCFNDLHKNCPGFSIKYGATIARTNRKHHGPLKPPQKKPDPQPSCQLLFNSIVKDKEKICAEMGLEAGPVIEIQDQGPTEPSGNSVATSISAITNAASTNPGLSVSSDQSYGEIPSVTSSAPSYPSSTQETAPFYSKPSSEEGVEISSDDKLLFENYKKLGGDPVAFEQAMCFLKSKGNTRFKSFGEGYPNGIKIENQRYVTIQDLTKPSSQKRLFILDRQTGEVEVVHSGHGMGVSPQSNSQVWAKNFGNSSGSKRTPSGFFITGNTYISEKSWRIGMRLHGLQEGINDKTLARGVVLHGGSYVPDGEAKNSDSPPKLNGIPAGRSEGCTVVNSNKVKDVMSKLASGKEGNYPYRGGSLYYNFSPSEKSKGPSYCGDQLVPEVAK